MYNCVDQSLHRRSGGGAGSSPQGGGLHASGERGMGRSGANGEDFKAHALMLHVSS